jgi:hypothetical protein
MADLRAMVWVYQPSKSVHPDGGGSLGQLSDRCPTIDMQDLPGEGCVV